MHFPLCIVVVVVVAGGLSEGARTVEVDVDGTSQTLPVFTDADMAQFDGTDSEKPIYIGVKGIVFDLSSKANIYGKGGSYNALVGRDSSRGLALTELDTGLGYNLDGLTAEQLANLDYMYEHVYKAKYPIVGVMEYRVQKANTDKEL